MFDRGSRYNDFPFIVGIEAVRERAEINNGKAKKKIRKFWMGEIERVGESVICNMSFFFLLL